MAAPIFSSPYNVEKRRLAEESALKQKPTQYGAQSGHIPPDYEEMDLILFPEGSLRNANNSPISQSHLKGKSVALYFADGADPKCTSFLPFLLNFYRTVNEAGSHQKIEVIFVSLDRDRASFEGHRSHMPWLSIDLEHPLTGILQRHFRVMKEYQLPAFGYGSRTGVPCVIVIGSDGREAQFLPISCFGREEGDRALLRWDWRNTKFSSDRFGVRPAPREQQQHQLNSQQLQQHHSLSYQYPGQQQQQQQQLQQQHYPMQHYAVQQQDLQPFQSYGHIHPYAPGGAAAGGGGGQAGNGGKAGSGEQAGHRY